MSIFFTFFPIQIYILYCLITIYVFPNIFVIIILSMIFFLRFVFLGYNNLYGLIAILVVYSLPELSHYLTGEETVLNINNISIYDLFDNFFFLLPNSTLALASYYKSDP